MTIRRRIAIAIPARNEGVRLGSCLERIAGLRIDQRVIALSVVVVANNCRDATAECVRAFAAGWERPCRVIEVELASERAHAGWARRLAFDAAADELVAATDVLLSTDADTQVTPEWLLANLNHLEQGYDAIAARTRFDERERRRLPRHLRSRLAAIRSYENALAYLRTMQEPSEPWPRHFDEGGASLCLTLGTYRRIGGAPTPSLGEDRALFDAIRQVGGFVRHPLDVHALTSPRLCGRAGGGASDTLSRWDTQAERAAIAGLMGIEAALGDLHGDQALLSFETLPVEAKRARALVAAARRRMRASNPAPKVEPVGLVALGMLDADVAA